MVVGLASTAHAITSEPNPLAKLIDPRPNSLLVWAAYQH